MNGGGNWNFNNNIVKTATSRFSSRSLVANSDMIKQ